MRLRKVTGRVLETYGLMIMSKIKQLHFLHWTAPVSVLWFRPVLTMLYSRSVPATPRDQSSLKFSLALY